MQSSSALSRLAVLFKEVSSSSSSPRTSPMTVCLREADAVYLYPRTEANTMLMRGIRPVGYNVAVKTYPPSIHTLLMHSGENAHIILLEDSSVIPVVDSAACLIQAKAAMTNAAILRDEEALVVWSMGTPETIGTQFREWELRINRTVSHAKRQKQQYPQAAMHPAMFSPAFNDWMPSGQFMGAASSAAPVSLGPIGPAFLTSRSDLPSLLELESLHSLDGKGESQDDMTFASSSYDFTSLHPFSPLLSPFTTCSDPDSLSPYSTQSDVSSLEPSPYLSGTICLADISPAPPSFDSTSLPDEDLCEVHVAHDALESAELEEKIPSPVGLRKIKGLPSRSRSTSPQSLSPLHLPLAEPPNSPKVSSGSSPSSPSNITRTNTTPLFSSLSLRSSPPLGKKRKSPSPASKSPISSPKAGPSSIPSTPSSLKVPGSPCSQDDADGSTESELSDLEEDGAAFEDVDDSDDDFEDPPPPKKTKVTSAKANAQKSRPGRRRKGKPSPATKRKFICPICKSRFTRDADKTRHLQSACEGATKDYQCPDCPAAFARRDALNRHCKNLHRDD